MRGVRENVPLFLSLFSSIRLFALNWELYGQWE